MNRINEDDWDLQQPLQPLRRVAAIAHIEEWSCECVHVDVDQWDPRGCPLHGPNSALVRGQQEREAGDQVAYYSGPDPFEEEPAERQPPMPAEAVEEGKRHA